MLTIQQFVITRSRLYAGGAYFKSKVSGPVANTIFVELGSDTFKVGMNFSGSKNTIKKYDGVSKIQYDGNYIFVDDVLHTTGNVLHTPQNRIVFTIPEIIQPTVELYNVQQQSQEIDGQIQQVYSLLDLKSATANSSLIVMPDRPGGDDTAEGTDTPFIRPFGRVYLSGAGGLPANAIGCDTGPFKTIVKVRGIEANDGSIQSTDLLYEWSNSDKSSGQWIPFNRVE